MTNQEMVSESRLEQSNGDYKNGCPKIKELVIEQFRSSNNIADLESGPCRTWNNQEVVLTRRQQQPGEFWI